MGAGCPRTWVGPEEVCVTSAEGDSVVEICRRRSVLELLNACTFDIDRTVATTEGVAAELKIRKGALGAFSNFSVRDGCCSFAKVATKFNLHHIRQRGGFARQRQQVPCVRERFA